jgi:hypothetical protein
MNTVIFLFGGKGREVMEAMAKLHIPYFSLTLDFIAWFINNDSLQIDSNSFPNSSQFFMKG